MLAAFYGAPGFGWGKPVPVDPRRLRWGRFGMAIVSIAGPTANVVLAIASAFVWRFGAGGAFSESRPAGRPHLGQSQESGAVASIENVITDRWLFAQK